jgi:ribosomal protein S18 acetylase RimI-like enzyme
MIWMNDLVISRLCPSDMRAHRAGMAIIHQAALNDSDDRMARYRDNDVPEMSFYPGLQCVAAFRAQQMVGFAIGYDATALPTWFDDMMRAVRGMPVASWLPDAWYFADIAVLPAAQRAGVGTRLHNHIMPLVSKRKRMLVTFHGDHPAKRFYTGLEWREIIPDLEYLPNAPLTSLMEHCP